MHPYNPLVTDSSIRKEIKYINRKIIIRLSFFPTESGGADLKNEVLNRRIIAMQIIFNMHIILVCIFVIALKNCRWFEKRVL